MRGGGTVFQRGRIYWIQYWHRGQRLQESTGTENKTEAGNILRDKLSDLVNGRAIAGARFTVEEAAAAYLAHLELRKGKSASASATVKLKPVRAALGTVVAATLDAEDVDRYVAKRRQKVGPASVNREVAYLRAALRLAMRRGKVARVPMVTRLEEPPPRQGFWSSRAELDRFLAELPEEYRDLVLFGFLTGWRRSEVVNLTWEMVAWDASPDPEVRIPRTKNREPRVIPIVGELKDLLERRKAARRVEREDGAEELSPLVFHVEGERIGSIRKTWNSAIKDAGLARRTWHDFRRTAARDLVNAGVPEKLAMQITGHKTRSIFDRYHITTQSEKAEALRTVMAYRAGAPAEKAKVTPIRRKQAAGKR